MRPLDWMDRKGWPVAPGTAEAWMALPEIPLGRYLLADLGWVSTAREKAFAAGVAELPAPRGKIDNGYVRLPAVTVVGGDGIMTMFRLPVSYAPVVRRMVDLEERLRGEPAFSDSSTAALPCHFLIGDRETVYLSPDGDGDDRPRRRN